MPESPMKTEVRWSLQVSRFVSVQPPDPRKKLRAGIRALAGDSGDVRPLMDELSGYYRLRVGGFRVIFREGVERGRRIRYCLFAERRDAVYELFRKMALDDIRN
jgi:mRNA-degrading endonuclease RelE of RelBE toxin-antitoxin system